MALWSGFQECWEDYTSRLDHAVHLVEYFKNHQEHLLPNTTKRLLSIGPGEGDIDHDLVNLLPNLTHYIAVEPDTGLSDSLKRKLDDFPQVQKQYVNDKMETYEGPGKSVDVILMSHVVYYFGNSFVQQINRALSWLNKKEGKIIVIIDQDTVNKLFALAFDYKETFQLITVDDVRRHLVEMRVNCSEAEVDYTLDVSKPGRTNYGFISVLLNHPATTDELDKGLRLIREVFIPGTEKVKVTQSVFIIESSPFTNGND